MALQSASAIPGHGVAWPNDIHSPVVRLRRTRRRVDLRRTALFATVTILIVLGLASLIPPTSPIARPLPQPAAGPTVPAWVEVSHPLALYELSGSPFARLPLVTQARRSVTGMERQDVLTFGHADAQSAYLRVAFARPREPVALTDLIVDLARLAAGDRLSIARAGLPTLLPTRFGTFDVTEITVRGSEGDAPCFGFRLGEPAPVAITGLACGTRARPLDRAALACAIDRIDILSIGEDVALREFVVGAERRRAQACAGDAGR